MAKKKTLKQVKTARGMRWQYGGKFISKEKASQLKAQRASASKREEKKSTTKRKRKAPKRRAAARATLILSNPRRKRKTSRRRRRNPSVRRKSARARVMTYTKRNPRRRRYKRNPSMKKSIMSSLASGAMFWAGLTGMKILNGYVKQIVDKQEFASSQTGATAKLIGLAPAGVGFLAAAVGLPKIVKRKNIVNAVQMGAAVALIDSVFNAFVYEQLPDSIKGMLSSGGGGGAAPVGYFGDYVTEAVAGPMGEYVDYDNRLGEYVDYDNRYAGFEVSEPLSDVDMGFIQSGGGGGVFAKTSLGWG